jgi:hypothetical protein
MLAAQPLRSYSESVIREIREGQATRNRFKPQHFFPIQPRLIIAASNECPIRVTPRGVKEKKSHNRRHKGQKLLSLDDRDKI